MSNRFATHHRALRPAERAQAMSEYILLVSMLVIGAIAAVSLFGRKVGRAFEAAGGPLDRIAERLEQEQERLRGGDDGDDSRIVERR